MTETVGEKGKLKERWGNWQEGWETLLEVAPFGIGNPGGRVGGPYRRDKRPQKRNVIHSRRGNRHMMFGRLWGRVGALVLIGFYAVGQWCTHN